MPVLLLQFTNATDHWYLPYSFESNNYSQEAGLSWMTYLVLLDILSTPSFSSLPHSLSSMLRAPSFDLADG